MARPRPVRTTLTRVRRLVIILVVAAAIVAVLAGLAWSFQRRLVYYPSAGPLPPAVDVLDGGRDVQLRTADGLFLDAWLVPASSSDAVTVLVAPGNGGDRIGRAPLAEALAEEGLGVLLLDYRGYAGNPGSPTEEGLALDVRAARTFLLEEAGVAADRLMYFGESLGAAVVTELAAEHPPAGLLLRSPFTDLAGVGREHYPFLPLDALLWDEYQLVEHLQHVDVPTTVVLGSKDTIVPPRQSRAVATAAPQLHDLVVVDGADHNDLALLHGHQLIDAVLDLAAVA